MRPHTDTGGQPLSARSSGECSDLLVCAVAAGFVLAIGLLVLGVCLAL